MFQTSIKGEIIPSKKVNTNLWQKIIKIGQGCMCTFWRGFITIWEKNEGLSLFGEWGNNSHKEMKASNKPDIYIYIYIICEESL